MCRSRYNSLADKPEPGFLAHILTGYNQFTRATVLETTEDGTEALVYSEQGGEVWAYRDIFFPDRGDGNGSFSSYKVKETGQGITFVRIPQVGDTARFLGTDLEERTQTVTAVTEEGLMLTLDDGSWAGLAPWGAYYWVGGSRGVEFTPCDPQEGKAAVSAWLDEAHPGPVTLEEIKEALEQPDIVLPGVEFTAEG
jgi:hypothetical protein